MTKKLFESLEKATNEGWLNEWLYEHDPELTKAEVLHIARELAYASVSPLATLTPTETVSIHFMRETFLYELAEYYDTFGFDEEAE